MNIGEALSSGLFLGAGLLLLLPEALEDHVLSQYPWPTFVLGLMLLLLLWFEHVLNESKRQSISFNLCAFLMLMMHAFFEGIALGHTHSMSEFFPLFIAIIIHKWIESLAVILLYREQRSLMIYFTLTLACATPLGMGFGMLLKAHFGQYPMADPIIDSIATATFIYIGTLHGLKKSVLIDKCCNLKDYMWVIIGFLIMSLLTLGHIKLG